MNLKLNDSQMKSVLAIWMLVLGGMVFGQTRPNVSVEYGFSVGSYTGTVNYDRKDIIIPSVDLPVVASFHYNGGERTTQKGYGKGWTFSYSYSYEIDTLNRVVIYEKDGSVTKYTPKPYGGFETTRGVYDLLEEYVDGKYRYHRKDDDLFYYFDDPSHKKVTSIKSRNGGTVTLSYSDTLLTRITDSYGRKLDLDWTNGKMVSITESNTGKTRVYKYQYDAYGHLVKMTNPMKYTQTYAYDKDSRMVAFSDENGNPLTMEYNDNSAIRKVSTCLSYVTFSYDIDNRKTFMVEHAEGEKYITTYAFDDEGRNTERSGSCCGTNLRVQYDNNNNIVKKVDGNNHAYSYEYDANGNVTVKTDPSGNTTKKEYDPELNKVLSSTNKLGDKTEYTYDDNGNLTKVEYPSNSSESYTYNTNGQVTSHTNERNLTTVYEYDEYGNLVKTTYPDNAFIQSKYDAMGNLLWEKDENQNQTTFEYDDLFRAYRAISAEGDTTEMVFDGKTNLLETKTPLGKVTKYTYSPVDLMLTSTSPEGRVTMMEYDQRGNMISVVDPEKNRTSYKYDELENLIEIVDALGNSKRYEYDGMGRMIMETDKMGNEMRYEYDENDRLVAKVDPLGNKMKMEYDAEGKLISRTDPNGNSTHFQYDSRGRKVAIIDPLGNVEKMKYDATNNLVEMTDKNGNVTKYEYDQRGRRIKVNFPEGNVIEYTFDDAGNQLTSSMAPGFVYTYTYDKLNRREREITPGGEETIYTYNADGQMVKQTLPNGLVIEQTYTDDGAEKDLFDNLGSLGKREYDGNGRMTKFTDERQVTTTFQYDILNRLVQQKDGLNKTKDIAYNANGWIVEQRNENQERTKFKYNELGLVIEAEKNDGSKTQFQYDGMGNVQSVLDAKGNQTVYEYDQLYRQLSIEYANGTKKRYEYDNNGNVVKRISADGSTTQFKFDGLNRLVQKKFPNNSTSTYEYDQLNRLTKAENAHATLRFEYDSDNRLIRETIDGNKVVSYSYDIAKGIKTITYPSGKVVEEKMDVRNRIVTVSVDDQNLVTYEYENNQTQKRILGNGLTTQYKYSVRGELDEMIVGADSLFHFQYTYDDLGNKLESKNLSHPVLSEKYGYDNVSRLIAFQKGVNNSSQDAVYSYDLLGNRVSASQAGNSTTYTSNSVNEYQSILSGGESIEMKYSKSGNLLSDGQNKYQYDDDNRLINVNDTIEYKYDALGRRYHKIVGSIKTTYFYYNDQVIEEQVEGKDPIHYFYAGIHDKREAFDAGNGTYFYHQNSLKSVIGISDSQGKLVEYYDYDAYGKLTIYDEADQVIASSTVGNHFFYSGNELDLESGLYYFRARHYDPETGRFLQRDPLSYTGGGLNLYEYVHSNPINYIDPYGLTSCKSVSLKLDLKSDSWFQGSLSVVFKRLIGMVGNYSVNFEETIKTCEICCEGGGKGEERDISLKLNASLGFDVNVLNLFPASRAAVFWARKFGFDIFGGVKVGFALSGSMSHKKGCDKENGSFAIELSGAVAAELSLKSTSAQRKKRTKSPAQDSKNPSFDISGGGVVEGKVSSTADVTINDGKINKNCKTSITVDAKIWLTVEINFLGASFGDTLEKSWNWYKFENNWCPFPTNLFIEKTQSN